MTLEGGNGFNVNACAVAMAIGLGVNGVIGVEGGPFTPEPIAIAKAQGLTLHPFPPPRIMFNVEGIDYLTSIPGRGNKRWNQGGDNYFVEDERIKKPFLSLNRFDSLNSNLLISSNSVRLLKSLPEEPRFNHDWHLEKDYNYSSATLPGAYDEVLALHPAEYSSLYSLSMIGNLSSDEN